MTGRETECVDLVRYAVGDAALVRVPYAEVLVDPDVVGLTPSQVASVGWAEPVWAEGPQVRVAAAVWVIESGGRRIVVDPVQAADPILRTGPEAAAHQDAVAAALSGAGFARESIDTVLASHIDGIGMIAWLEAGEWSPFFPNAEVILSEREYAAIADSNDPYSPQGHEAIVALHAQGAVTTVGDAHTVTDAVSTRLTGGHSPGHQVIDVESDGDAATFIGHLALSPLHCTIDDCSLHMEPAPAVAALQQLRDERRLLIGPLWPTPGGARWTGAEMEPAS